MQLADEVFDDLVSRALDLIPADLAAMMDNVVVLVEHVPPAEEPGDILGLYVGTPLTERGLGWESGALPDVIYIFRRPVLDICDTLEDVVTEVVITVVHEIAHHFGISDGRLHELGWG